MLKLSDVYDSIISLNKPYYDSMKENNAVKYKNDNENNKSNIKDVQPAPANK